MIVNLSPHHVHGGWLQLDLDVLGVDPSRPFQAHDLLTDAHYGLGWRVYQLGDRQIAYHSGWVSGYRADIAYSPSDGLGITVLLNAESSSINRLTTQFELGPRERTGLPMRDVDRGEGRPARGRYLIEWPSWCARLDDPDGAIRELTWEHEVHLAASTSVGLGKGLESSVGDGQGSEASPGIRVDAYEQLVFGMPGWAEDPLFQLGDDLSLGESG